MKEMLKIKRLILIGSVMLINLAFAQGGSTPASKILTILNNFIKFAFSVLMILGSGMLIYVGILYISGKTKLKEEGGIHKAIAYIILGIVLLLMSFFIPNLIENFIKSSIK